MGKISGVALISTVLGLANLARWIVLIPLYFETDGKKWGIALSSNTEILEFLDYRWELPARRCWVKFSVFAEPALSNR
jgi:hypothetical protein